MHHDVKLKSSMLKYCHLKILSWAMKKDVPIYKTMFSAAMVDQWMFGDASKCASMRSSKR